MIALIFAFYAYAKCPMNCIVENMCGLEQADILAQCQKTCTNAQQLCNDYVYNGLPVASRSILPYEENYKGQMTTNQISRTALENFDIQFRHETGADPKRALGTLRLVLLVEKQFIDGNVYGKSIKDLTSDEERNSVAEKILKDRLISEFPDALGPYTASQTIEDSVFIALVNNSRKNILAKLDPCSVKCAVENICAPEQSNNFKECRTKCKNMNLNQMCSKYPYNGLPLIMRPILPYDNLVGRMNTNQISQNFLQNFNTANNELSVLQVLLLVWTQVINNENIQQLNEDMRIQRAQALLQGKLRTLFPAAAKNYMVTTSIDLKTYADLFKILSDEIIKHTTRKNARSKNLFRK